MLKNFFEKIFPPKLVKKPNSVGSLSESLISEREYVDVVQEAINKTFQVKLPSPTTPSRVGDSADNFCSGGKFNQYQIGYPLSPELISWFGSKGFIGYQLCAMISQDGFVNNACFVPGQDVISKGYDITINDGTKVSPEIIDEIRKRDSEFKVNFHMKQFIGFGRVFGIRIALFEVDSDDPDYYCNPFNPDGITPGSYRGISEIDPYWITPELDSDAAGNPASQHFYEPTWWRVNGRRIHRTHVCIFRTEEVADILKPTYYYGGISIPQLVAQRIYSAERSANEAPNLAMTKRTTILKADLDAALGQGAAFERRMQELAVLRNNYGIKLIGLNDEMTQLDISLTDFDQMIKGQYELACSVVGPIPVTKLMGTSPKGMDATGESDEANYHEFLRGYQTHDLTPFLNRHHLCLIRSEIAPKFGIKPFSTTVTWKPLDALTEVELANVNETKSRTANNWANIGAINGQDARDLLISDPHSGYSGLSNAVSIEELPDEEQEV